MASRARKPEFESSDRSRNDVGHDPRALAAAENQQPQRIAHGRIGRCGGGDNGRPNRIAGQRRLGGETRLGAEDIGKRGGDRGDARRQQPIGPPDDRVGVVDQGRNAAPGRRKERRDGRITAEADHRRRFEPADQRPGLDEADAEHGGRARCGNRVARAQCRAGDDVGGCVRDSAAIAHRTPVGDEMNGDAALP